MSVRSWQVWVPSIVVPFHLATWKLRKCLALLSTFNSCFSKQVSDMTWIWLEGWWSWSYQRFQTKRLELKIWTGITITLRLALVSSILKLSCQSLGQYCIYMFYISNEQWTCHLHIHSLRPHVLCIGSNDQHTLAKWLYCISNIFCTACLWQDFGFHAGIMGITRISTVFTLLAGIVGDGMMATYFFLLTDLTVCTVDSAYVLMCISNMSIVRQISTTLFWSNMASCFNQPFLSSYC